ncbi:hypothetical protein BDFG_05443 [Blastomyces dermatitidis ATCC 26199]|nr:hypothetical protein BDFG_05443 [Blastomyces dermatitidis ATCC 26199]
MDNNTPTPPPHQQMRQNQSSQRGSREKEQTPQSSSSSPGSEPASQISSMTSRIQDSASGLLQNTFSAPSSRSAAHDIASTLATGLDSSGKGSSSSHVPLQSGSSTPGTIPQSHGLSLGQPSSRASEARRFPSESFRSAPPSAASNLYDEDDYRTWERFQDPPQNNTINDSNGGDALLLHPYDVSSGKGKGKFRTEEPVDLLDPSAITTSSSSASLEKHLPNDTFDFAWHNSTTTTTRNHNHSQNQRNNPTRDLSHHTSYTPHSTDGQAVVALLSSPTFQPATFTPPESPESELFELDASMLQPPSTFSSSSSSSSPNPSPTTTGTTTTTTTQTPSFPPNQLSLIPDINSILTAIQQQQQQQSHPHDQHGQDWEWDWREMPGVAEWLEVDGTYQDTVWGFLKPYVEAARKEIIERREDGGGGGAVEDGPAVKRLRMVMRHLRARL